MNPQQTSSLIATLVAVALAPTSYFVVKGFLSPEQAAALQPAVVTVVTIGGGALIAWWGHVRNSANALTLAVNSDSAPGVKVVRLDSPSPQVIITKTGAVAVDHSPDAEPPPPPAGHPA
jgi:hypothetical protein